MKGYLLIIIPIVLIISILITLNIFFQQSLQLEVAEQFNSQQYMLARSIAENISSYISSTLHNASITARLLSKGGHVDKELMSFLTAPLGAERSIKPGIALIDEKGRLMFMDGNRKNLIEAIENVKSEDNSRQRNPSIFEQGQSIIISVPIYYRQTFHGTLFYDIEIHDIAEYYLKHIKYGIRGYSWMIDKKGTLLYHPTQPGMVGGNIYRADPKCYRCHSNFNLEKRIIEGKVIKYGRYIAPSGEDKIIAFASVDTYNISWTIAVSSPFSEITNATKNSMELYSYLIIAIFVATSFVSGMLIVFNKKRIQNEELAKRQESLERYAIELADKVQERTIELTSEKEKLNTILSALAGGVIMIDIQSKIQWVNQAVKEMAGKDITGMYCEEICLDCSIVGMHRNKDIDTIVMSNLFNKKDNYFQVTTAPIKGDNGEVHGYIRLIQDITEMKKMEEQIAHSEKLASIGRLAAGIAHEIGNPMTSIFSFVQILREEEDDPFKKESLDTIYFHVNRVSEILKQLSGFSRMPAGEARECSINEIIETSINLIQYDKKAKDVKIIKRLATPLPSIIADGNQLSQIFVNLILNAIDAMPNGGELTVSTESDDNEIIVRFADTGVGISSEDISRIFDPFYTTKEKGTGLGLAVSYNIIRKMNGEISVDSNQGKGTTFTITLPLRTQ